MHRLTRMDGLRGLLAVYVMLGHALPFTALPGWATAPFRHGEAAVDLFFCLSGLVIMASLERFGFQFRPFMAARARRLLTVYFAVLALSTLLLMAGNPVAEMPWLSPAAARFWVAGLPQHFIWHLAAHVLLLHGLLPAGLLPTAGTTLLTPAWSLSTEWQFYVLLALLAPRRIAPLAIGLLALGAGFHAITLPPAWQFSRAFLPDAAPYFALGLASIPLLRDGNLKLFLICLTAACAIGLLSGAAKAIPPLAWGAALLAQRHRFGALLDSGPLQFLGRISYPLYLLNEPLQRALAMPIAPLANGNAWHFTLLWLPLALSVPILGAAALHHGIERRFTQPPKRTADPPALQGQGHAIISGK
jgi:peptidoglycan/LPS O-acetylase OafA/YrhL